MSGERTITRRSGGVTGRLGRSLFAVTFGVLLAALVDAAAPLPVIAIVVVVGVAALLMGHRVRLFGLRDAGEAAAASSVGAGLDIDSAAIVHDLRSPLITTRSYLELLAGESLGPLPEGARAAVERASRAAAQAERLVEQSLRMHAVEAASVPEAAVAANAETASSTVDLSSLIGDVTDSLRWEIEAAEAQLDIAALPNVVGDRTALFRIFANLVQNAVRHGKRHDAGDIPPHVSIEARMNGAMCEIEIRDAGAGIPLEMRERVFDPGFRSAGSPGEGLGLATARQLVLEQGGWVWIDRAAGTGTSVRLSLPAAFDGG